MFIRKENRTITEPVLRGLAVLLPTILTLWILAWGYGLLQEHVSVHVNRGLVKALVWFHRGPGMSEEALAQYQSNPIRPELKLNTGVRYHGL